MTVLPASCNLTNTNQGLQYSLTAQLQKPFGQGKLKDLSLNLAYTYSRAWDINSATSSRAISNWQYNQVVDPNNPGLSTSLFEIRHRILANVSYTFKYGSGFATTLGLFYEGRSGSPYSFVYNMDASSYSPNYDKGHMDATVYNDLCYIPTGPNDPKVKLVSYMKDPTIPTDSIINWPEVEEFLSQFSDLERGKIVARNSQVQPWRHQVDFRYTQIIPTFENQRIEITVDILNLLNLLNSDWGVMKYVPDNQYKLFTFKGYTTAGNNRVMKIAFDKPGSNDADNIFYTSDFASRWQMQLGIRYYF